MHEAGSESEPPENVTGIEQWKAEQFLKQLACKPFLACVVSDGQILLFETGVSQDDLRKIQDAITELIQED